MSENPITYELRSRNGECMNRSETWCDEAKTWVLDVPKGWWISRIVKE